MRTNRWHLILLSLARRRLDVAARRLRRRRRLRLRRRHDRGGPSSPRATARPTQLETLAAGNADDRDRQPGLPALLRGRRPDQRQGLRERRRLRDRRAARLRARPTSSGSSSRSTPPTRPGPKDFDFDVNQISITPKRAEQVDFSSPYYEAKQAVVALKDSDAAERDVARRPRRRQHRRPDRHDQPRGGRGVDPAGRATRRSSTPRTTSSPPSRTGRSTRSWSTCRPRFFLTAVQVPEATIVGQFAAPGGDEWGALLEKDSPLTDCVSAAIDELRDSGELAEIEEEWMSDGGRRARPRVARPTPSPDRRAERAAARARRDRRGQAIAAVSTIVVLGGLAALILTSPGWPDVRETFFNSEDFTESSRTSSKAFWLDIRMFMVVEVVVLILGLVVALARTARAPALFPAAAARGRLHRRLPRHPDDPARLPDRVRRPGARPRAALPTEPVGARRHRARPLLRRLRRRGLSRRARSVHRGQRDAALAVGLTESQALRHVVLPQAVRRVGPPLLNDFIALQKDVALIAILGVAGEAFRSRRSRRALDFNYTPLLGAALLYLAITIPLARLLDWWEPRGRRGRR